MTTSMGSGSSVSREALGVLEPSARQQRLRDLLSQLCLIRAFEEECLRLFRDAQVRGAMHLCIGQEAVPVGACAELAPEDYLSYTYRSHGWALARGIPPREAFAEILGRATGSNLGRGGTKHLADWSLNIAPGNAIVGGHLPLATGIAFASKTKGLDRVTLAVFGEGATNQGSFHEALSLAGLWRLPIVFLCENNMYSELTPAEKILPVDDLMERATGYGIESASCDGMDPSDVAGTIASARSQALRAGPVFVEAKTYRFCGHHTGDQEKYRTKEEVDRWRTRDPIELCARLLRDEGVSKDEIDLIRRASVTEVLQAKEQALSDPEPAPTTIGLGVSEWNSTERPPWS